MKTHLIKHFYCNLLFLQRKKNRLNECRYDSLITVTPICNNRSESLPLALYRAKRACMCNRCGRLFFPIRQNMFLHKLPAPIFLHYKNFYWELPRWLLFVPFSIFVLLFTFPATSIMVKCCRFLYWSE